MAAESDDISVFSSSSKPAHFETKMAALSYTLPYRPPSLRSSPSLTFSVQLNFNLAIKKVGFPCTRPAAATIISIKKSPTASILAATLSAPVPTTVTAATVRTCPLSSQTSDTTLPPGDISIVHEEYSGYLFFMSKYVLLFLWQY
ncbi:P-loop containing nucleoside triphosphatehydrolases superfamily protein [Striga asiatica]|uniref:P-loop containing nucleoside triphosphatehydrolases superfamily protein n=1 Tax=Striga asiatica TaxID=4170 RepID=A0A5A7PNR9_STRAF|nr:P-loop containing nucleoside triphosphatehydrolases superfamily protein [Striga asiatica]